MQVLLADGEPDVRWALRLLLIHDLAAQAILEASTRDELWTHLQDHAPDLLLLDWGMFGAGATQAVSRLRAMRPDMRIVALSCHTEEQQQALAAGADAFVCKTEAPGRLMSTLRALQSPPEAADADDPGSSIDRTP